MGNGLLSDYPLEHIDGMIRTKSLFARLPAFIFGISAALIYLMNNNEADNPSTKRRLFSSCALLTIVLVLGLILQAAVNFDGKAETEWHIHHSLEAACWSLILLLFVTTNPIGKSLFINNINAFLEKISYSIYLLHMPIMFYIIYPIQQTVGAEKYIDSVEAILPVVCQ